MNYDESVKFYHDNYELLCAHKLKQTSGKKVMVNSFVGVRKCRFCDKSEAYAKFEGFSHAVPEMLGNKNYFSNVECDDCNHKFGITIEQDFGHWSKPRRVASLIKGKKGKSEYFSHDESLSFIYTGEQLNVEALKVDGESLISFDEETGIFKMNFPITAYKPINVLKTFIKIALTFMPEKEIVNLQPYIDFLNDKIPTSYIYKTVVELKYKYNFQTIEDTPVICVRILKNKLLNHYPGYFLIFEFGNYKYIFPLHYNFESPNGIEMPLFPEHNIEIEKMIIDKKIHDLSGIDKVYNDIYKHAIKGHNIEKRPHP